MNPGHYEEKAAAVHLKNKSLFIVDYLEKLFDMLITKSLGILSESLQKTSPSERSLFSGAGQMTHTDSKSV